MSRAPSLLHSGNTIHMFPELESAMPVVTSSEYSSKLDLYQSIARSEPVIITTHGQEQTVLISAEEYRRLTRRRRRPFLIEDLPDEDWAAIEAAHADMTAAGSDR